jgi:hypothetical protein
MSTKVTARGVVGSLRLLGVTAAVAAGIAGFAPVQQTEVATTEVTVVAGQAQLSQVFKLPQVRQLQQRVCDTLAGMDRAPAQLSVLLRCVVTPPVVTPPVEAPVEAPPLVIEGPGPVEGAPIFS